MHIVSPVDVRPLPGGCTLSVRLMWVTCLVNVRCLSVRWICVACPVDVRYLSIGFFSNPVDVRCLSGVFVFSVW